MDQPPAAPLFATDSDTIEEETGEGLLLNDPLVMSMYQTSSPPKRLSPDSSPDSSPVRPLPVPQQLAEESLSDREFEQMEAAAAVTPLTDVSDFRDFGHPNLMDGPDQYVIRDPFRTPGKVGTKSSDEDEYEVIPQTGADVSNLMSLSPEHSFTGPAAADTTIMDYTSAGAPSPPPPLPAAAAPSHGSAGGAEESSDSQSAASSRPEHDDIVADVAHAASSSPAPRIPDPSSESDSEPDPVSPVPVQIAAPKKTDGDETITRTVKQQPGLHTVSMASADSSTSGCPFTAVADLVFWKDPRKSGIAFGTGLVILLSLACCSVISVIAYTGLTVLTGTLSFRVYKNILQAVQKTNEGHPFREYLEVEITPPNERVHQMVDVVLKHVNAVLRKLRSVFLVEDIIDSLKFVVLFWVLTYIGAWFNGLTLVILSYLSAFSLPIVYEMHKTQIDQAVGVAVKQVQDVISAVKSKIPFPAAKDKKQE